MCDPLRPVQTTLDDKIAPDPPAADAAADTRACRACDVPMQEGQDWCLACGAPARTRLAPAPNWKLPIAGVVALLVLALVALVVAFAALTDNPSEPTGTTSTSGRTASTPSRG